MNAFQFGEAFFENNLQVIKKVVILQPRKRNDVLYKKMIR
jgi:hypothetical protein